MDLPRQSHWLCIQVPARSFSDRRCTPRYSFGSKPDFSRKSAATFCAVGETSKSMLVAKLPLHIWSLWALPKTLWVTQSCNVLPGLFGSEEVSFTPLFNRSVVNRSEAREFR